MTVHVPILLRPIVDALIEPLGAMPAGSSPCAIVDCTLGGGGHTSAFLEALQSRPGLSHHRVISVDQDLKAIENAKVRFKSDIEAGRLKLIHSRFSEITDALKGETVMGLMADLGFSSDQIQDPGRGMSFQLEGPLDMRLDPSRGMDCRLYLSQVNEAELARVIWEYGEDRFSRKIAAAIIRQRSETGLPKNTRELAQLIERAVPPAARHGRIHAATRTFQALRIVVNQELEELDTLLNEVIFNVQVGGRVAILSFHSLEDRRVKQVFKDRESKFKQLTKKPIEADELEVQSNPRSRSAKLRIAERKS